jgi:hypothetical protein
MTGRQDGPNSAKGSTKPRRKKAKALPATMETGVCFFCREPIIADQPGGVSPRHKKTGVPYGKCLPDF